MPHSVVFSFTRFPPPCSGLGGRAIDRIGVVLINAESPFLGNPSQGKGHAECSPVSELLVLLHTSSTCIPVACTPSGDKFAKAIPLVTTGVILTASDTRRINGTARLQEPTRINLACASLKDEMNPKRV